jgi:hypothetical protein
MNKALCTAGLLWALAGAASAAEANEPTMRVAVDTALWPGDIVQAADKYLRDYPDGPGVADVRALRQRATEAWRVVRRNDVQLYRSAFVAREGGETLLDMHRASLGDRAAAVRLAHASRRAGDAQGMLRYVGWLQFASVLGDERASYELALHFRRTDDLVLAARYEAVAIALGYQPAPGLDHLRK